MPNMQKSTEDSDNDEYETMSPRDTIIRLKEELVLKDLQIVSQQKV